MDAQPNDSFNGRSIGRNRFFAASSESAAPPRDLAARFAIMMMPHAYCLSNLLAASPCPHCTCLFLILHLCILASMLAGQTSN
ncbi:hypothetical protein RMSM_06336 [Rhodopirellula maiorica SM1]|uniref:Uncharacterized protein n=1 Tax=Rhodopirellula maiorica SM1 TaxID=1265738 RepID=M5RS00_9BACT|nr:hypothetical protein RMSM_06336 [Rhodopirellula maiorica SM1]